MPREQLIEVLSYRSPAVRDEWIRTLGAIRATNLLDVPEQDQDREQSADQDGVAHAGDGLAHESRQVIDHGQA